MRPEVAAVALHTGFVIASDGFWTRSIELIEQIVNSSQHFALEAAAVEVAAAEIADPRS